MLVSRKNVPADDGVISNRSSFSLCNASCALARITLVLVAGIWFATLGWDSRSD